MSNLLLVFMFLLFTIPSIAYHEYLLALLFTIFGGVFGFVEFVSDYYTGDTVSQQIGKLLEEHNRKGLMLLLCMLGSWGCWILHFMFTGVIGLVFMLLMFLALFIPSMLYKTYFLSLTAMIFVLCLGFTDGVSLSMTGQSLIRHLHTLWVVKPFQGSVMLVGMVLGWICLLLHLGIKFVKK